MEPADVAQRLDDAERVLLLAPTLDRDEAGSTCEQLMAAEPTAPGLYVSLVRQADDVVASWYDGPDAPPLAVVTLQSRGPAAAGAAPSTRTEVVSDPGDLTGMGIAVTECLDALPPEPRVCFDSLTVLLQYVDVERAFRFLHVLSRYLADVDGSLHVHLDPATGDDEAVATLASLFDAVASYEEGDWSVTA